MNTIKQLKELGFNPCFIGNPSATIVLKPLKRMIKVSFNPCFIGNPSATIQTETKLFCLKWFQSLFYWKSFCNLNKTDKKDLLALFQSLFYWKSFCNIVKQHFMGRIGIVSILVLLEILLQL